MRFALLTLALLLAACASVRPPTLNSYRGVYTTHFDGVPDQIGICAVITNPGPRPVDWVSLKLRSISERGELHGQWSSRWLYPEPLAPGETVAVRFMDPPSSDRIELRIVRLGTGPVPRRGRPLRRMASCSEAALRIPLEADLRERSAPGIRILAVALPPDADAELQVAQTPAIALGLAPTR